MTQNAVLVVGGAGYIGSHTAKALKLAGFLPIVIDDLSTGHVHNVKYGPFVKANMNDKAEITAAIKQYNPITLMHFAACIEVGEGEKDPIKFYKNNVANAINLFETVIENGIKNIVFSSTAATFGIPKTKYIDENHPQEPINTYGRTKLMVEKILQDLSKAYGINHAILRYFNACGADADGELGEEHSPETHLIPNVLASIAQKRDKLSIFGNDYDTIDGTCVRDYIHVTDLANAHVAACKYLLDKNQSIALNLGTKNGNSVLEIMQAAERVTGLPCPREICPRRAGDPDFLVANSNLARQIIGFSPINSNIDIILKDAWNFHKKNWGI